VASQDAPLTPLPNSGPPLVAASAVSLGALVAVDARPGDVRLMADRHLEAVRLDDDFDCFVCHSCSPKFLSHSLVAEKANQ